MAEKAKLKRGIRQTVGVWAYFFPSLVASGFEMESALGLEDTSERLQNLSRIRISRPVSFFDKVMGAFVAGETVIDMPTSKLDRPVNVMFDSQDIDTYTYQLNFRDELFQVQVRGYLKRWEANSTLITGQVQFDLHYTKILFKVIKSFFIAVAVAVGLAISISLLQFRFSIFGFLLGETSLNTLLPLIGLLWLPVLAVVWINDVVAPAHLRRYRLVTRLEDALLYLPL
ncbi:MAG TPA: hypothetical protein VHO69_15825 [Phototrophicaceae bacterium]|nr:hypothetical protein [Phototrophicaceae bacterium]